MGNRLSKELTHAEPPGNNLNAIEIMKNVYKTLLLGK